VVGVGESTYFRHGRAPEPEFVLTLRAILAAAADASIDPRTIDGFASFANDRNTSLRVANALGVHEMRWSSMQWGGGGGGGGGAVQHAAAAVATGCAETVVVYRGICQGQYGRFGAGGYVSASPLRAAYGMRSPAELFASRMTRFMAEHDISPDTQKAVALASYHHAQRNPRALMHGRELSPEGYDASRWIVEPWRLYDCCQESDGAAALIVTSAERARDLADRPAFVLGAVTGGEHRSGGFKENVFDPEVFATAEFTAAAARLFESAVLRPEDVDVVQAYENFTGGVVMALIEHGLVQAQRANELLTFENLVAPTGGLPLNTAGGNLAEAYIHGLGLTVEGVRQISGGSPNPVPETEVSLVVSGPMVTPATSLLLGTEAALG
jgi:acetyl-CoA acetyltransferase